MGYKRPPRATKFQKGQSGNPKGRPKGAKNKPNKGLINLRDLVLKEAQREVTIQDKSGPISMPVAQAAIRSLALKAAQGTVGAQKLFLESVSLAEASAKYEQEEAIEQIYAFKRRAKERIQYYASLGEPLPDEFWPDPDHINFDSRTGELVITGPMDEKENQNWDAYWHDKRVWQESLTGVLDLLEVVDPSDPEAIETIGDNLGVLNYILALFESCIILRWNRPFEEVVDIKGRRDYVRDFIDHIKEKSRPPKKPNDYLGWW